VDGYPFVLEVSEILARSMRTVTFFCKNGFQSGPVKSQLFNGIVDKSPHYTVNVLSLDHKIPSLAYSLEERFHININKERLTKLGLPVGPWLRDLKGYIWEEKPDNWQVKISEKSNPRKIIARVALGELKQKICTFTRGQKIVYVSDCRGTEENFRRIIRFAANADIMFCEGSFLSKDRLKAEERGHLTAEQAGLIAREARVKALQIYHFSPRYENCPELLYKEAEEAFRGE
jgi:ribonuclease Z